MQDKLNSLINDTGFDSFCFVIEKKRCFRLLKSLEVKQSLRLINRNKAIKGYMEQKFKNDALSNLNGNIKHPYRVRYINFKRANKSLTNTLIMIENNIELNELCKKRKKAYGTYVMVVFAGLYQPSRDVQQTTYKVLKAFLNRFNIWAYDLAKDFLSDEPISAKQKERFKSATTQARQTSSHVFSHKSTIYANHCKNDIKKVFIYDKYLKQSAYHKQKLSAKLKAWKRVEMRINVRKKFKKLDLNSIDYYDNLLDNIVSRYQNKAVQIPTDTLFNQLKFFLDARRTFDTSSKLKEYLCA